MRNLKKITGRLENIHIEPLVLNEPIIDFASRFSNLPGTVVLMSGGELDSARYHILAAFPWLTLKSRGCQQVLTAGRRTMRWAFNPFEALRRLIRGYALGFDDPSIPVGAGLFGYLSYDLKDYIEKLPRTVVDALGLPQICLFAPSVVVVHDKIAQNTRLCIPLRNGQSLKKTLGRFQSMIKTPPAKDSFFSGGSTGFSSSFTRPAYLEAVSRIKDCIVSGHIYQVNLSQRFETDFSGNPYAFFKQLYHAAPAPFYAYVHAGDHYIVSTSPERFLLRRQSEVETRPIKGTRPRGRTKKQDKTLGQALKQSQKDAAELSMIVDLMRNDLGRVCRAGSVHVAEHKRLEPYKNVFHLVSVVKGVLQPQKDTADLLLATFPGGSITGCPRIRAMEIIDELEPVSRHVYTGSIGYIGFHDTLDLSIAIRTATIYHNKIFFSAGGGVVFDSNPGDEYDETLHKARSLLEALKTSTPEAGAKEFVWLNGALVPKPQAKIPIGDLGFQYGFGFFETLRVHRGRPAYLKAHIQRFYDAWKNLFQTPVPDITWNEVIGQVLEKNNLLDQTAAVKIMAAYGEAGVCPCRHSLVVTAKPYAMRPAIREKGGLDLATYPHPRQTPLADHKTLNYLYYFLAGRWAQQKGADEAMILNPDGSISETNTANLLMIKGKHLIRPKSAHCLAGIMEQQVIARLTRRGYRLVHQKLMPRDLFSADEVILTNSLIGAVPVLSLDQTPVGRPSDLCARIRKAVF